MGGNTGFVFERIMPRGNSGTLLRLEAARKSRTEATATLGISKRGSRPKANAKQKEHKTPSVQVRRTISTHKKTG